MLLAFDVAYVAAPGRGDDGYCAAVGFESWASAEATCELTAVTRDVPEYVPGRLVERELPCVLVGYDRLLLEQPGAKVEGLIVDGNVRLDAAGTPGLGGFLYDHFDGAIPVIGVAKKRYRDLDGVEVYRGQSARPLIVTAAGIDEQVAATHVRQMAGTTRIPTMLHLVDKLARTAASGT